MDMLPLLRAYGPDIWASRIRLVRHHDAHKDLRMLLRRGHFGTYEAGQGREVFAGCAYILSFLGQGRTRSLFLGCRRVLGVRRNVRIPADFPYAPGSRAPYWYDLQPVPGFEALEQRLVIDWGAGTRAWVQWLRPGRPRTVIEVLPAGYVRDFPGHDAVVVLYDELCQILRQPEANRAWHVALGEVAGVYLITDTETGDQYVGSAWGEGGILGRWTAYARTGHGGNQRLRAALGPGARRRHALQFSILRPMSRAAPQREVVAAEGVFKRKLGTRAHGLNAN